MEHHFLDNGLEVGLAPLPGRAITAMEIRLIAGYAYEKPDELGAAHLLSETITKGTARRDGRGINDAFDEIGAAHDCSAGRETISFSCLVLPEFLERAIDLHAEIIRTPSFPDDACSVAIDLARQELAALDDEPGELAKKLLNHHAYGQPLGRHVLGEERTLADMTRDNIIDHWQSHFHNSRMVVSIAGNIDPAAVLKTLEQKFADGPNASESNGPQARQGLPLHFKSGSHHFHKKLEQEQVGICFPGAARTDRDYPVERVVLGVLSGGMSGRLFTEVREKQGLVYWVGAWNDQPRGSGIVHLGASTTPQNLEKTYNTLLREIDRLGDDLTEDEIDRAKAGIKTRTLTRGDVTRSRARELINDLFFFGRPIDPDEKLREVEAVTLEDIRGYLQMHPRDNLCVVTLGPKEL